MMTFNMQRQNSSTASTQTEFIRNYVVDYCSSTTIQGFRYFTERRRHWTERCWWLIAVAVAIWFCGTSIRDVWIKWQDHPVTMSIIDEKQPISTIPFPTVVVCHSIAADKSQFDLDRVSSFKMEERTEVQATQLELLSHLCEGNFSVSNNYSMNASDLRLFEKMAPKETIQSWSLLKMQCPDECSRKLAPILTDRGVCFAFNMLNSNEIYSKNIAPDMLTVFDRPKASDWSMENGYSNVTNLRSYPIHVFSSIKGTELSGRLRTYKRDITSACTSTSGYFIYLLVPGNAQRRLEDSIFLPLNELVRIEIKPTMTTTAEGLRKYSPNRRQCYFNSDRQLHLFKFYSQENCESECLANYTIRKCGCASFYMPRNSSTKICGTAKIECYKLAYYDLFAVDIIDGMEDEDMKLFRRKCACLPACTTISSSFEIDRNKIFEWQKEFYGDPDLRFYESELYIAFKHHEMTVLRREEQYTVVDFLAICGGILGLCLGISALSIVELIYFATIRLFWSFRHRKAGNVVVPSKPRRIVHLPSIDIDEIV